MEENNYKTFDDLSFKKHKAAPYLDCQATITFENGYGISVISGEYARTCDSATYECACFLNDKLVYPKDSSFEDDVVGNCTKEDVTELMIEIQKMKQQDK